MISAMNDYDFEEKLLLNALNDKDNHQQQKLNLSTHPTANRSADYHHSHRHYQQQYFDEHNKQRYNNNHRQRESREEQQQEQQHDWNPIDINEVASTVSMTTDETLLDNFQLFDGDHSDMVDSNNDTDALDKALISNDKHTIEKSGTIPEAAEVPSSITTTETKTSSKIKEKNTSPTKKSVSPKRNRAREDNTPATERLRVETPTNMDILCGQSRVCASHPGNRRFQTVLESFASEYDIATSKQEKMTMTKAVVSIIHDSGGRFLKYRDDMWEEISTVAARDKVSHALRTKVASWKRQSQQYLQQEKEDARTSSPKRRGHSKSAIKQHRRGSRGSKGTPSSLEDYNPISFDANEASSEPKLHGLLHSQREFFASYITPQPGANGNRVTPPNSTHGRYGGRNMQQSTSYNSFYPPPPSHHRSDHFRRSSSKF